MEAQRVILAAGSLGSTKMLLRMSYSGQLPGLSPALGTKWSENGDLLGCSLGNQDPAYPSTGPVITGAIRFFHSRYPDSFPHGLFVEDAGIPNALAWYLTAMTPTAGSIWEGLRGAREYARGLAFGGREINMGEALGPLLFRESSLVSRTMIFLGMGRDRSSGVASLKRPHAEPFHYLDDCDLQLDWEPGPSQLHLDRVREAMQRISVALGGQFVENPLSDVTRYIAVHTLGGCPMADSSAQGVVDAGTGEVFEYPGLYVMDGSIVPTSIGPNPSLTIAALAEMFMERFP